jgi:choline dehydrogenase-like flavoprotein
VDKKGLAQSVLYFDINGVEYEQKARLIVVSGGAIQSPRLLLNSISNLFPDGLANNSGLVGKYFTQHFGVQCTGRFAERIDQFRGFTGGDISQDFCRTNPKLPFARGYRLDLTSGVSGPAGASRLFSSWGQLGKKQMTETFGYLAGLVTQGEQLPDIRNRVEVDKEVKDQYGMPVARLTMEWYENERAMLGYMKKRVKEIMAAAGATNIVRMSISKIGKSPHNLGTCRMGKDPRSSVLNSFCQTHEVPNLFVVDGSFYVSGGTANPSLTIHAIAVRASDFIAEEGKKGNLWSI